MTDRELIELAAEAAGINGEWMQDANGLPFLHNWENGCEFDPLSKDGDALRLAVKLSICLGPNFDNDRVVADSGEFGQHHVWEMFGDDKYAATRRAIVRAAAEIGKQMEGGQHDKN